MRAITSFLAAAFFMLTFQGCEKREKASVDLKGYVMKQCGSNVPESNVKVTLGLGGVDLLTATTDANGYFHIKGEYDVSVCSQCGDLEYYLAFVGNGGSGGFYQDKFASNFPNTTDFDTIYLINSTSVQINVLRDSNTSENDSLWIAIPKVSLDGTWDSILVVGPIHDTTLPTIEMGVFSHVGYPYFYGSSNGSPFIPAGFLYCLNPINRTNWTEFKDASLPFVYGQPNNACGRVYNVTIDLSE
jgi:hypothetical protein